MVINTKYSIGDKVWVMRDDRVREMEVVGVRANVDINKFLESEYYLNDSSKLHKEPTLFSSKQELLQSL